MRDVGEIELVGRGRDTRAIRSRLRSGPLTITGPLGVGKSAVAAAIVRAERGMLCDVSRVADAGTLLAAIAQMLGQPIAAPESVDIDIDIVVAALQQWQGGVLALDNFDDLIPGGVSVLERLIERSPGIRWIVTSRERLGFAAEGIYQLAPLGLTHAATLFATRLRVDHGRAVHPRDEGVVRALVGRLDGIPLAIGFAAGLAHRLGPRGVLKLIEREWSISDPRSTHDTTDVLAASFAIVWERLTPAEQLALREIAVFESPFTPEAVRAVLSPPANDEPTLDVVERLVRKNLVSTPRIEGQTAPCYALLSTMRDLARRMPQPEGFDLERTTDRHASYLLELIAGEPYDPFADPSESERRAVRQYRDDCIAVIDYLRVARPTDAARLILSVSHTLECEGPHDLSRRLLESGIALLETVPASIGAEICATHALAARLRSEFDVSERSARRALDLAEFADDDVARARAHVALADVLPWQGRLDEALEHAEKAVVLAARSDLPATECFAHGLAMLGYRVNGRSSDVERSANRAVELSARVRCSGGLGSARLILGTLRFEADRLDEAEENFKAAREVFRGAFDRRRECYSLNHLGSLEIAREQDAVALGYLRQAARSKALLDSLPIGPFVHLNLGIILLRAEDPAAARAELGAALAVFRERPHREYEAIALGLLAALEANCGDADDAARLMLEAERVLPATAPRGREDLEYLRGVVECAEARREFAAGRRSAGDVLAGSARARLTRRTRTGLPAHPVSQRLLERALERTSAFGVTRIVVASDSAWFIDPNGSRHDLSRRKPLKNVLHALVRAHGQQPLDAHVLRAMGWPGERMVAESALNRVWVAVSTLRGMGLANVIVKTDRGYCIEPSVLLVEAVETASPRARRKSAATVRSPRAR